MHNLLLKLMNRVFSLVRLQVRRRRNFHIKQSRKVISVLGRLRSFDVQDERILPFLRMLTPTTFEELVLAIAEREGCFVWRRTSYTDDGGFDGRIDYMGETWLVKCKRYKKGVNAAHVRKFARLTRRLGMRGLFVHTGEDTDMGAVGGHYVRFICGMPLVKIVMGDTRFVDHMYGWKTQPGMVPGG